MKNRALVAGMKPVAERLLPDDELQLLRAVASVVNLDNTINSAAVGQAVILTRDTDIIGVAAIGTDMAPPRRMPQAGRIVRLDAIARTAPSGGEFTATCYADGVYVGSVSIANGSTSGASAMSFDAGASAVLTWNVTAANAAADIALSASYRVS